MEWLGDRGLLKETENTLPGAGQEHRVVDTGQVPADSPEHNRRATLSSQLPNDFCSQLCAITLMWLEAPEPTSTTSPHQGHEAAVTKMESGINSPHSMGDKRLVRVGDCHSYSLQSDGKSCSPLQHRNHLTGWMPGDATYNRA